MVFSLQALRAPLKGVFRVPLKAASVPGGSIQGGFRVDTTMSGFDMSRIIDLGVLI